MQKRFGDGVKKGQPGSCGLPSYLKAKLYLFQLKTRSLYIAAVGSNHYVELAGFVYILYVVVVELQQFGGNGEGHLLAFAFLQVDALEAFQLFHGAGNAAHQVADIELYDFICIVVARIGYGYGSGQLAVRIQLLGAERDVTVLEGGVAQAIAEGVQRVVTHIQVVAAELLEPFAFFQRTAGILVIVCHRQLAHILWESGGQLTAGANVSEHYVGNGVGSFTTSEPYIQDGGNIFILPSQHYGTSREQYQYYGLARFQQCFQQVALCVRHFQFGTAAAHHSSRKTRRGLLR